VYLCVWGALGGYALALLDSDDAPDPTCDRDGDGVREDAGDDVGDPAPGSVAAAPDGGPR
jgi:hypothetical protein